MAFRVGIVTKVRNEASYLLEWISFHLGQGVQYFRIYDNGSDDETVKILQSISEIVPIDLIRWKAPFSDEGAREVCLKACLALRGHVDFAAFIDVDEFLFTTQSGGLPKFLQQLPSTVSAVAVNQSVFGSNGQLHFKPNLVTARFTKRAPLSHPENNWIKTIVRPETVVSFTSEHSVHVSTGTVIMSDKQLLIQPATHPGIADRISNGPLRLNHYMLKSRGEFEAKKRRWTAGESQPIHMIDKYTDGYFLHRSEYIDKEEDFYASEMSSKTKVIMQIIRNGIRNSDITTYIEKLYDFLPTSQATLVMDGDSLTQGVTKSLSRQIESFGPVKTYDVSVWGDTLKGRLCNYDISIGIEYISNSTIKVLHLAAGSNDLRLTNDPNEISDAVIKTLHDYCKKAKASGFKIVVATILPRNDFDECREKSRHYINEYLRLNWSIFADQISDWAADEIMGNLSYPSNVAMCEDGIHPTALGYERLAKITKKSINTAFAMF